MTKQDLTIPKLTADCEPQFIRLTQIPVHFMQVDWLELASFRKPLLKFSFEENAHEDWLLHDQIEIMAENMGIDFIDAAHWALKRALSDRFETAREMEAQRRPWDADIQYVCRVFSLQLCKFFGGNRVPDLKLVDGMVNSLLISEDELLLKAPTTNSIPI